MEEKETYSIQHQGQDGLTPSPALQLTALGETQLFGLKTKKLWWQHLSGVRGVNMQQSSAPTKAANPPPELSGDAFPPHTTTLGRQGRQNENDGCKN